MTATATEVHPSDILMHLIVALLAPMFVTSAGGDMYLARMAAFETLNQYRARNHMDLIAIAQVIACGLAALGSLSLSLGDDLTVSMTLRLRGNAVALNRMAEQQRRRLEVDLQGEEPTFEPEPTRRQDAEPVAAPVTPADSPDAADRGSAWQADWASAMTDVAGEFAAQLGHLGPEQRDVAARQAAMLSQVASLLSAGSG